jgi:hypothetical protein
MNQFTDSNLTVSETLSKRAVWESPEISRLSSRETLIGTGTGGDFNASVNTGTGGGS